MKPLAEVIRPTTFLQSAALSARLGATITLITETFQRTGSFKFRAAYQVATQVPHPHLITASSGNFGQALACACQMLDKRCTVVMPDSSARVKVEAVRGFGAEVHLIDVRTTTRQARVEELATEHPEAYVASAYDDPLVIDGNASLGLEIARSGRSFDCIVVPVGGGGLASGIIQGLRASGSQLPVTGAEPLWANDAARSLRAGRIVRNDTEPATIADGARTLSLGKHNWEILRHELRHIVEVTEEQIRDGLRLLFQWAGLKAEPTGALAVGALLAEPERFRGSSVACLVSGGNVDPSIFQDIVGTAPPP